MVKKCLLVVAGFSLRYIVVVVSFFFCIGITNVEAVTRTWDGGIDADTNWSTPNNWSGDTIPTSTDDVVFDGTSTENSTVDSSRTVASISINSGYTGTITQSNTMNVTVTGNFTQAAGTWTIGVTGNTTRFIVNGTLNKTGGNLSGYDTGRIELNGSATFSGTGQSRAYMINCSNGVNTTTINLTFPSNLSVRNTLTIGTGTITGTGQVSLFDGCQLINSGTIDCTIRYEVSWIPFFVYSANYKDLEILCINGPAKGTLTGNITCTSLLLYHNTQAPDTSTLDTAGYSITASSINVSDAGVGSVLKCNGSAINVSGNVTIGTGRTIIADSSAWNIGGTLINNGTLNVGTSTFEKTFKEGTKKKQDDEKAAAKLKEAEKQAKDKVILTRIQTRIKAIREQFPKLRMVIGGPCYMWGIDKQIEDDLKSAGMEVFAYPDVPLLDSESSPTISTRTDIMKYNIIIFGDSFYHLVQPDPNTGEIPEKIRGQVPLLRKFLEAGGSIWFSGIGEQNWGKSAIALNYILKELDLDAEVVGEVVKDKLSSEEVFKSKHPFYGSWTRAEILPDSLTKGIKELWHPSGIIAAEGSMGVVPITKLSSDWRVLVKGSSTTASFGLDLSASQTGTILLATPETVKSNPVLCAVRQAGKGRVVLWPTWSNFTVTGGSGGLLVHGEKDGIYSDGAHLIENILCWLAEPSQESKSVGTFDPEKDKYVEAKIDVDSILDTWESAAAGGKDYPYQYKGLIGAHSNLSDGTSSPEQMIESAKNAGYDFIAFTENFAKMTEEKWNKLLSICDSKSDSKFIAYPGLDFLDESDNRCVVFGNRYWPKDDWRNNENPDRIRWWYNFAYGVDANAHNWSPRVIIRSKTNNKRPWNQGLWTFFGAYCYEDGKLVDDSFAEWPRLIGPHVYFLTTGIMAIHTVYSANKISESSRNGLYQTYVRAQNLQEVLSLLTGCTPPGQYFTSYISAGPKVLDCRIKAIWPGGEGIDCAISGNNRALLHILVEADAGLKDISVYDGEKLVRRFLPEGNKFENFMTFHPESYHAYFIVVTDKKGHKAVSWTNWMQIQELVHRRCGDNWNWMKTGKGPGTVKLPVLGYSLLEVTAGWVSRKFIPSNEQRDKIELPSYKWYGQGFYSHGGLSAAINGYIYSEGLLVEEKSWPRTYPAMTLDFATIGPYGSILTNIVRDESLVPKLEPSTIGCYSGPYKVVPSPWSAELLQYVPFGKPDGAIINRYSGKVKFTKDVRSPDGKSISLTLGGENPETNILEVMNSDNSSKKYNVGNETITGEIPVNGYICWYDDKGKGVGGIIALSDGINYSHSKRSQGVNIFVPSPVKAGTEVTWDVIFVNGNDSTINSNSQMEDVRLGMGIAGKPTLYKVQPRIGKVIDQKYFLTLESKDNGFSGKIVKTTKKQLPIHLPVFIHGLNPRWDAGIWYQGKTQLHLPKYYADKWGLETWRWVIGSYEQRVDEIRYIPVLDKGIGYCQIDTDKQDPDVFIGNLLVCNQPDVFISVIKAEKGICVFEVNNPTDKTVTVTVRPSKGFDLVGKFEETVSLPAGGFKTVTVDF